jgi:hypothetical protein
VEIGVELELELKIEVGEGVDMGGKSEVMNKNQGREKRTSSLKPSFFSST